MMVIYILKRLCRFAVTLTLILALVFALLRRMPEDGYFNNYDKCSEVQIQARLHNLGLDEHVAVQFGKYMAKVLKGDLGVSSRYQQNQPITGILAKKAPVSAALGLTSLFLALLLGLPLGVLMARSFGTRYKLLDRFFGLFLVCIQAVPAAAYLLLIQLYGSRLLGVSMLFDLKRPATWILPVVSLCLGNLSFYALWLRRYILEERGKDYVTFARAKGAGSVRVGFCHIFRNGIVPLVQFLPGSVMATLMGTIYVESLFSVPGMGGLLIQVIKMQDNTMVQALVLLYSALSMAGLFLGDLLMAFLDPRIRVRGMGGKEPCV